MVSAVNLGNQCERPCRKYSKHFPSCNIRKWVARALIWARERRQGSPPRQHRQDETRGEGGSEPGREAGREGGGPGEEEGGESGRQRRESRRERGQRPARAEVGIGESAWEERVKRLVGEKWKTTKKRESWGQRGMVTSIRWREIGWGIKDPRSAGAVGWRSLEKGKPKWGKGRQLGRKKGANWRKGGKKVGEEM